MAAARALPILAAWLALTGVPAHADQTPTRPAAVHLAPDDDTVSKEPRIFPVYTPAPAPLSAAWFATTTPAAGLSALSCLAALLSCAFSFILWRRVDSGQEAAKASMYAAGKLFDSAARRFSHSQDEAGSAVETATSAAGQAGQAAARLAAAVRDTEARLSASLGEGEARLHAAAGLLARYDGAVSGLPALLAGSLDGIGASAVPAIEDATAALRHSAETTSARLMSELRTLPDLMAEAVAAADARGAAGLRDAAKDLQDAAQGMQSRAALITRAADILPDAGDAFNKAIAGLAEVQARHDALITRAGDLLPGAADALTKATAALGEVQARHDALITRAADILPSAGDAFNKATAALAEVQSRHDALMTRAADILPGAGDAIIETTAALAAVQARHDVLIGRMEALAGVLPSIATSLASTAAGQRQLLSQGRLGVDGGVQELRHAASVMSASVDEAATLLRKIGEAAAAAPARLADAPMAAMHPALRPRDLGLGPRGETPGGREAVLF